MSYFFVFFFVAIIMLRSIYKILYAERAAYIIYSIYYKLHQQKSAYPMKSYIINLMHDTLAILGV